MRSLLVPFYAMIANALAVSSTDRYAQLVQAIYISDESAVRVLRSFLVNTFGVVSDAL